jgi:hypothetical protein
LLSGKRLFNKIAIDEEVNELKQRWHTYVLFHNAAENNRSFDMFKDILRVQFEAGLGGIMEGEKSFIDKTPHYFDIIRSKFENELKALKADSMQCLDTAALKLICRSRFYYTQAEAILMDIQQAAAVNPEIDVREAALLATINYVTDYVADQLTLTKGKPWPVVVIPKRSKPVLRRCRPVQSPRRYRAGSKSLSAMWKRISRGRHRYVYLRDLCDLTRRRYVCCIELSLYAEDQSV